MLVDLARNDIGRIAEYGSVYVEEYMKLVPENILFVAESGIKTNEDIKRLREANVNGVLIGETFMRSENKAEVLKELARV